MSKCVHKSKQGTKLLQQFIHVSLPTETVLHTLAGKQAPGQAWNDLQLPGCCLSSNMRQCICSQHLAQPASRSGLDACAYSGQTQDAQWSLEFVRQDAGMMPGLTVPDRY